MKLLHSQEMSQKEEAAICFVNVGFQDTCSSDISAEKSQGSVESVMPSIVSCRLLSPETCGWAHFLKITLAPYPNAAFIVLN